MAISIDTIKAMNDSELMFNVLAARANIIYMSDDYTTDERESGFMHEQALDNQDNYTNLRAEFHNRTSIDVSKKVDMKNWFKIFDTCPDFYDVER